MKFILKIKYKITDTIRHTSVENQGFGKEKHLSSKSLGKLIQHKKGYPSLGQKYGQK